MSLYPFLKANCNLFIKNDQQVNATETMLNKEQNIIDSENDDKD